MPAWWKVKSKSKSKSTSSPRTKEPGMLEDQIVATRRGTNEKGPAYGSASSSASASSNSSSGSSDDRPDVASYRSEVQRHEHIAEGRQVFSCGPVSEHPVGENGYSHAQTLTETIFSRRTANLSPGLEGSCFATSPVHPGSFSLSPTSPIRWQDNLPSPPHPLPLPPSSLSSSHSPSSSSSRSPKTQWKKGKLLGRGTFGHVYLGFNRKYLYLVSSHIPILCGTMAVSWSKTHYLFILSMSLGVLYTRFMIAV